MSRAMPKTTTSHDPDLDELPGFDQADLPDPLEDELLDEPESLQESPAPSTTSPSPSQPLSAPGSSPTPSRSTKGSTDPDPDPDLELAEGLEFLAGGLFDLFGQTMNRMARVRRRGQPTNRWIATDDEIEKFAEPAARIAERHLPDELKGGDAKDVIVMGSVAVEYGVRNLADLEAVPPAPAPQPVPHLHEPGPPPPAPAPPPVAVPSGAQPSAAAEEAPLVSPSI
jgi:hypothetical protein